MKLYTRFISLSLFALSAGPYFISEIHAKECKTLADVVFVLDESSSLGLANFKKMLEFVKATVQTFEIGNDKMTVGVMKFGTTPRIQFHLNRYYDRTALLSVIDQIAYQGGSTYTDKALTLLSTDMFTARNGDRENVSNIGIVITDGKSSSPVETLKTASTAQKSGINIITIGIGDQIDADELRQIASSKENVLMIKDFNTMQSLLPKLITLACEINCSPNPCLNNGVCRVESNGFSCLCTDGYTGNLCATKDKCSPNPCLNNGVCRVESNGFSCLCTDGYTGNLCATKDKCSPNPCLNNGVCRFENNGFSCVCTGGYTGNLCATEVSNPEPISIIQETNTCKCQNVLNKLDTVETLLKKHDEVIQKIQENMSKVPRKIECVFKDVASNQLTSQSSDWPNLPSQNAVDGIFSTMSHTMQDKQPFWWVDLGRTYKVQRIEIYNRKDCCGERLHDLDVLVGPTLNSLTLCNHYQGPGTTGEHIIIWCSQYTEGRFVKLMILKQEWLHVAEVKVYGCD